MCGKKPHPKMDKLIRLMEFHGEMTTDDLLAHIYDVNRTSSGRYYQCSLSNLSKLVSRARQTRGVHIYKDRESDSYLHLRRINVQ